MQARLRFSFFAGGTFKPGANLLKAFSEKLVYRLAKQELQNAEKKSDIEGASNKRIDKQKRGGEREEL
ncbi:MAG: hypothetical protein U0Y68_22085 [Blastocatellia bacterium]